MEQFRNLGLSEAMLHTLKTKGFSEPTPIQKAVIPFLLKGDRDVVAQAETGTGKTAAFGIPIIEGFEGPGGYVRALVLVPTRELAIQVAGEIGSLAHGREMEVVPVYGGQPFGPQRKALRQGADIVVGTAGRILDHLEKGTLDLSGLTHFVLDEADEMLDMGFIDDIRAILEHAPSTRRTMLFSATMPREVVAIAKRYMGVYETISTTRAQSGERLTDQVFLEVRQQDRFEALCRIIDMDPGFYGLVFCRTRVETGEVAARLAERGYGAECIHGEMDQPERERIMHRLRTRAITVLVATDVAARGIDIGSLTHVVNYDPPQDPDAYLHRIGRTGRAGRKGVAVTLVTPHEVRTLELLRRTTGKGLRKGSIPCVRDVVAARSGRVEEEIRELMQGGEGEPYEALAAKLLEGADPAAVLAAALRLARGNELDPKAYREIRAVEKPASVHHTRLFIARGRKHGMTRKNLLRFLREHSGVKAELVRDIEIRDDFTFISMPRAEAVLLQKKFHRKRGRPVVSTARPERDRMAG
ncbi:MAG TPA: DEAD/DEAH box helicase [Deltaproteobacteria bacterium]|jgi:ATP-dependent RNA helicase DeaD|nr:DEAD/DEAH box helicase [Deltaproteobacteria bacterium]HOI05729.1 DEAD/DEAH box helicase [Deltaproteobacteria bacterium]